MSNKFLFKNNLKRITKKFNEVQRGWQKDAVIEWTGFFNEDDQCEPGRNRMNTVCRLLTKRFEYNEIQFKRPFNDYLKIYFNTPVREGYRYKQFIYIEVKNNKNIDHLKLPVDFSRYEDAEKWIVDTFRRVMGYRNDISGLKKIVSSLKYSFRESDLSNPNTKNAFVKLLKAKFDIGETFRFNNELSVSNIIDVKESANILTIVYKRSHTYESRVFELKIRKPTKSKFIRLRDIGGELPGYYTHSENLKIHEDDLEAAKKFIKRVYKK